MTTKKLLSLFAIISLTLPNLPTYITKAATINQSCAANPTLTLGVDFNSNDDLNLNGGGTCTITIDQDEAGADSTISLNSLTITGNTTLTHAVAGTTASHHNEIDLVVTGDVSIESGSSITVTGKGYLGAFAGANASQYGRTNGNTTTGGSYYRIAGAHGGRPGKTSTYQIAESYDSIINPALPGGGGGASDSGFTGGTGGGVVRITAANIAIAGNIIADGGNGSQTGGAGGTIYLNASGTISGAGSITANGGGATGTSYSGGGGGRIALLYGSFTHSGTVSAYGYQSDGALEDGSAGTIFKKATADANGYLTINNNSYPDANFATEIDSTNDTSFDGVTLQNYGRLFVKSSATSFETTLLTVNSNSHFETDTNQTFSSIDTTSLYLNGGIAQFDGDLNLTNFDTTTGDETGTLITNGSTYVSDGNITVGQNLLWQANGAIKTSSDTNLTSMTIKGTDSGGQTGGILTHSQSTTSTTYDLNFTTETLTVESGSVSDGTINVSGKGYLGGYGSSSYYVSGVYTTDTNSSQYGRTNGNTTTGGSYYRISGSHGGQSGKTAAYAIADAYDSIVSPALPGGGGGAPDSGSIGGNGGGIIDITATNASIQGDILANGASGHSTAGAGGSIKLTISETISGSGAITANGAIPATNLYTGGGGGRISITYATYTHDGTLLAAGGNSDGADEDGAAGTVYKKSSALSYGDLIINNNDNAASYYATSLLTTIPAADQLYNSGYAFNSVTVGNYGILNIPAAVDSSASADDGVTENFHSNSCPADDDTASNGEITYDNATVSGATTSNYTCFGLNSPATISATMSANQQADDGFVNIVYTLSDSDEESDISLSAYEYSLDNSSWSTMTIADDVAHSGIVNLSGDGDGTTNTFVWDACTDIGNTYDASVYVRFTPNDGSVDGDIVTIDSPFAVDCAIPVVSNVSASQTTNSRNVSISYDLADDNGTDLVVAIDISEDSGSTWTVTDTSTSGNIGSTQTTGNGKTITWNAGTDFDNQDQSDLRVRVRAIDKFQNAGANTSSGDFALDTLDPASLANLSVEVSGTSATLSWTTATDTNFNHYEIWYGTDSNTVTNRTATEWDDDDDSDLLTSTTNSTTITGLTGGSTYYFKIWAVDDFTNESTTASTSAVTNSPPSISTTMTVAQQTDDGFVDITYSLTDANNESDISLSAYEYSLDNSSWSTMTIADDILHNGIVNLSGDSDGTNNTFVWDACADIGNTYDASVYARFTPNDGETAGATATIDTPFAVDCAIPIVSNVSASQTNNSRNISISYDLADDNGTDLVVAIDISEDSGSTWTVTDTSTSGNIGSTQTTGNGKTITWNAGTDFDNQDQSDLRVRVRAIDKFQNAGINSSSGDFALDTQDPASLADLSADASGTSATLSWTAATDTNFNHYEIWYGTDSDEVTNRTAAEWDNSDDNDLLTATTNSTTITGLTAGNTYYFKIWAIDDFTNETTTTSASAATNQAPSISTTMTVAQQTNDSFINIIYSLTDADTETDISLTTYEYSLDNTDWSDMTVATDDAHSGIINLSGDSDGTNNTFVWDACADIGNTYDASVYVRFTPHDGTTAGARATIDTPFAVDCASPSTITSFAFSTSTTTSITVFWNASSDNNFNHYEIWYDTTPTTLDSRSTANEWDNDNDSTLTTASTSFTTITGLEPNNTYYFKIWAIDNFGQESTTTRIDGATKAISSSGGGSGVSRRTSTTRDQTTETITETTPETTPEITTEIIKEAISELQTQQIISGYPDGSIKPEKPINRAELIKIVIAAASIEPDPVTNNNCFPDATDDWYARYACFAKAKGWIQGYENGTFGPADNPNKEQTQKILFNILNIQYSKNSKEPITRGDIIQTIYESL